MHLLRCPRKYILVPSDGSGGGGSDGSGDGGDDGKGAGKKVVMVLAALVLRHDVSLRMMDKEQNKVLRFTEFNIICQCLAAAFEDYQEKRVLGKAHPSGKAFKDVAWPLLWQLAAKA